MKRSYHLAAILCPLLTRLRVLLPALLLAALLPATAARAQNGITFTFDNAAVSGSVLEFDVMVQASAEGVRLGDTEVFINYNALGFGTNVVSADAIDARLASGFYTGGYYDDPILADVTPTKVRLSTLFIGLPADGVLLSGTPKPLLHVTMQVADQSQTAGLNFDQVLMTGLQFVSDNTTVFGLVDAADTENTPLAQGPAGITFTFANCDVVGGRLVFDVMVHANQEGTRLGDTQVYLNYNTAGFGPSVASGGNITATLGPDLAVGGFYNDPIVNDNTGARVSLTTEFLGGVNDGVPLPTTPMVLLRVELTIADADETAGLSFDEPLMEGQQFHSDNATAYDPVTAQDTKDDPLQPEPTGITFTFDNCVLTGNTLSFDILVHGSADGTRLGDTQVYLNYNADAFGANVVGSGNLAVTRGAAFAGSNYLDPFLQDNTASKASLAMEFVGNEADGVPLTTTPTVLFHVELTIDDANQTAGLSFDQGLMTGQQYESDNATAYDPVTATDTKNPALREVIGIEFTFANCDVTANVLEFDVMVAGEQAGTLLGDTQVYLNYNTAAFGMALATLGNISVSLAGDFAADGRYSIVNVVDNTGSRVAVTVDYDGPSNGGVPLPASPIALLHVTIQIQNDNETSGISFEEPLMQGQQFESNESIAYDPVIARDTKDEVLREHIGITFTFDNCVLTRETIEFDILVQGEFDVTRLGDTQVYLDYNALAFGSAIAAGGKITATLGPALAANGHYLAPVLNDNTASKVSLAVEFVGQEGDGIQLPTTPLVLLHVVVEIADHSQTSQFGFDQPLMVGQQFEDDNATPYDPVTAADTKDESLAKPPVGITFTFGVCRIVDGKVVLDVMIHADEEGTRLGDTQVYLNYNDLGFGANVAGSGNISATLGPALAAEGNYAAPILNDNTPSRVSIATEYLGGEAGGVTVPTTPMLLVQLEITIADDSQTSQFSFEQPLMAGNQFESDQQTAYDPVRADDTRDKPLVDGQQPTGITFTFADCVVADGKISFNVLVAADEDRSLGNSEVFLNYNTLGFGANVASGGNIAVTLGAAFAGGNYAAPAASDETPSRVRIATAFTGPEGGGVLLTTTPQVLLHVEITIADPTETAGISFEQPAMVGGQFEDDNATAFDPVRALGQKDDRLGEPIGLTFTFANCTVADGKLSFDVLVAAAEAGRRLGDTQVYLDYNAAGFGPSVVANGNVTATLGATFSANGFYGAPLANDNTASRVSLAIEFNGAKAQGVSLTTTPVVLLHVELTIDDPSQTAGLTFAEAIMQGQQFESDNETAFDPVVADDTSCRDTPLSKEPIGIHFSFQDCRVEDGRFEFDVLVQAAEDGTRLGDTQVYLNYNDLGFGPSVVLNGKVTVTPGAAFVANGHYLPPNLNDNTAARFSVTTEFTGQPQDGLALTTTPVVLFHVSIEIADDEETSGVTFEQPLMAGQQFESDSQTAYDPVTVDSAGCDEPLGDGDDDDDDDGIPNDEDFCPGSTIPESVPTVRFSTNRWALVDGDNVFDTKPPNGKGPKRHYTTEDTGGCSCEQIIEQLDLGEGHRKHGCSNSAMDDWVAIVQASSSPSTKRGVATAAPGVEAASLQAASVPTAYVFEPAYPNPFNPEATIRFAVRESETVRVVLYNTLGQLVKVLYDGTPTANQTQTVRIDGSNLSSGMYLVRLVGTSFAATQTVTLLK